MVSITNNFVDQAFRDLETSFVIRSFSLSELVIPSSAALCHISLNTNDKKLVIKIYVDLSQEIESSEASIIKDSQRRKSDTEELPLIKAEGDDLELVQSGDGELELMPSGDGELELLNSGAEDLALVKALEISLQETKDNKQVCLMSLTFHQYVTVFED